MSTPLSVRLRDRLYQLDQHIQFRPDAPIVDASVLVAITEEAHPHVLLTRRADFMRQHSGEVALPGGKREPTDDSNIVTALRETYEETALPPNQVRLIGELPCVYAKSGLIVQPIVGIIPPHLPLASQPSEIARIFYMPLEFFVQCPPVRHTIAWQGHLMHFPSVQYEGEVIWGLTARILISLLEQGFDFAKVWSA